MGNKITLAAFLALPKYEKLDEVFTNGNFLCSKVIEKQQVILYSLDRFLVELYFDARVNKIVRVNSYATDQG